MTNAKPIKSLSDNICWRIAAKLDVNEEPNWKTLIKVMPKSLCDDKTTLKIHMEILKPRGSPTLALLAFLGRKNKTVLHLSQWIASLKIFPDLVQLLERGDDMIRNGRPIVVMQPQSELFQSGEDIEHGFEVRGEQPLSFQWFKGIIQLQDNCENSLRLPDAKVMDSGFYICRVSNQYGCIFTDWIKIDVCDTPYPDVFNEPLITMHPRSVVCQPGDTLQLYADAVGYPAPFLQWFRDDEPILGQCSRDLVISNVNPDQHDGLYKIKASNKHGTAVSLPGQVLISKGDTVSLPGTIEKNEKEVLSSLDNLNVRGPDIDCNPGVSIVATSMPTSKVALLIGNESYVFQDALGHLVHPINDTYDVTAALMSIGFQVVSLINLDLKEMEQAVRFFGNLIDSGAYALFYFAGHGFEIDGESYLMPVDATDAYKPSENYPLSKILKLMTAETKQAKLSVLLADCCRTEPEYCRMDPIPKLTTTQRKNVIIGYGCCSKGRVLESPMLKNGYFAQSLVENITKDIKIDDVLFEVSKDIHQERIIDPATGRTQVVYRHSTVVEDMRLTQEIQRDDTSYVTQQSLLWQQAHIAPESPVTILENEYGTVELIFTAQFSNCLLIQSKVTKNPSIKSCDVMFILPQTIGGAQVQIILPETKDVEISNKVVRISNLEKLEGDIEIHVQVMFEEEGGVTNQSVFYRIKEKPLYAKVVEKYKQMTTSLT